MGEKQGYLGELDKKGKTELIYLLTRQENLLKNKKFVSHLPDKGQKIMTRAADLRRLIASTEEVELTTDLMEEMTLVDEEMREPESLHLEGKDVNVMNRLAGVKQMRNAFCPHRTLRSNLGDLLEEISEAKPASQVYVHHSTARQTAETNDLEKIIPTVDDLLGRVDRISSEEMRQFESKCSNLVTESLEMQQLDSSVNYRLVSYCLLTNIPGENGEICRIMAKSRDKTFSGYCLPSYVSTGMTRNYGVKIEYRRSTRTFTRYGEDTKAQPTAIVLKNFVRFLDEFNDQQVILVSVGQSGTLLYNFKSHNLPPPNVLYANCTKSVISTVCSDRVITEQRIVDILGQCAEKSTSQLLASCKILDLINAEIALTRSISFTQRLNSFRGKLFDFSMKEKEVISQTLARRLAEVGLDYGDLESLYRESELALVAVLARCDDCVRVTRDVNMLAPIIRYFRHRHSLSPFAEVLTEGRSQRGSKIVPLDESLKLMYEQKERMKKIQIEQAKQRLTKNVSVKMTKFDPEATHSSLKYREVTNDESDGSDSVKDEDDSETEMDYPD